MRTRKTVKPRKMMKDDRFRSWLTGFIIPVTLLTACATLAPTAMLPASPTPSPSPTTSPTATPPPFWSPTTRPTPTADWPTVAPPPGLVYRSADGLWRVDAHGRPILLSDRPDVLLSPDAKRATGSNEALLVRDTSETGDTDIWIVDLTSGAERNLTGEANRIECCPQWWPGGPPDVILFGSWLPDGGSGGLQLVPSASLVLLGRVELCRQKTTW